MSDGFTREPGLRPGPVLPEHLLTDEQVERILGRIDNMDRAFLVRHMRAAEKAAWDAGRYAGVKAATA